MKYGAIISLFQPSKVAPFMFGDGYVISSHTLLGVWLFIRVGIYVNPC